MGAEEHAHLAGRESLKRGGTLGLGGGPAHEGPGDARLGQKRAHLVGILLCEDGRGRHERGLPARVGDRAERKGRHGGLARPDVSQKQPAHGKRARHVVQDLGNGRLLVGCERKGQRAAQRGLMGAVNHVHAWLHPHDAHVATRAQGDLQEGRLVEGEPAAGVFGVGGVAGVVDGPQGPRKRHEAPGRADGGGPGVERRAERLQALRRQSAQPLARKPLGGMVDGHHRVARAAAARAGPLFLQNLPIRGVQAFEAIGEAHLTEHEQALTLAELLRQPRLAEEAHHDDPRVIVA